MKKLKLTASYIRLITCLLLHRNVGKTVNKTMCRIPSANPLKLCGH